MAITTLAGLDSRKDSPGQRINLVKTGPTPVNGRLSSMWLAAPLAGVAPTTAAVPSQTIAGAVGQADGASALRMVGIRPRASITGTWILCDRVSHQGGLSGTVTTAQTTNLPTAALTRYTNGVGVWCALEIYGIIGTTATTVTASYTNDVGATGQVTPAVIFGGTNFREVSRMIVLPNAAGDNGFQAVASVTVLVTTGTAGNFGVTLFRPLAFVPVIEGEEYLADPVRGLVSNQFEEVLPGACLFWLFMVRTATIPGWDYDLLLAED